MGTIVASNVTRTATVFVRHSANCKDRDKGSDWHKCNCRKSLLLYDGSNQEQQKVSAKTRSWLGAEKKAQEWLDQFDPEKAELARLRAKKEAEQVTIERAVAAYLGSMKGLSDSTVNRLKTLLGDVDSDENVIRDGKLFDWLARQIPRPACVADITPEQLLSFRSTWNYGSDLTTAISWDGLKSFFKFCVEMGWITNNPAGRRPKIKKGNRTATFTDAEYEKIRKAAKGDQLLEAFLELLRWSGMALIDGVLFEQSLIDDRGVLSYKRQKTAELATVKLPEHVLVLLRGLPPRPFRNTAVAMESNLQQWRRALQDLFADAGITRVKTEVGERNAHPHMLRDTCAVWYLRHGIDIYGVAKILGHSNPMITAKHYAPFVKELQDAHIDKMTAVLDAAKPKQGGRVVSMAKR